MMTSTIDRRAAPSHDDTSVAVGHALRIQDRLGTVGAVEYLKSHAIGGAVIRRVLSSAQVRASDRPATRPLDD